MAKSRKEMDPKFQWDFTHIFPSKEAWENAYKEVEARIPEIAALQGKLCESAESLKKGLDTINEISEKAELVYLYAMLHKSGDGGDPEYQQMEGRAISLIVGMSTVASFVEPEILAADESVIKGYMEEPSLASSGRIPA